MIFIKDIEQLPPELLIKGRFDEIFFVDLPSKEERKAIFKIHIKNRNRDYTDITLKAAKNRLIYEEQDEMITFSKDDGIVEDNKFYYTPKILPQHGENIELKKLKSCFMITKKSIFILIMMIILLKHFMMIKKRLYLKWGKILMLDNYPNQRF